MIISDRIKILDQGNCDFVRDRGKEAYVKSTSLRTETFYKAGVVGELAQHSETHDSATQVKNEVAGRKSLLLPGGDLGVVRPGLQYAHQGERLCQQCQSCTPRSQQRS